MARSRRHSARASRSTRARRVRKPPKPKDVHVRHGGSKVRTVNAPKTW